MIFYIIKAVLECVCHSCFLNKVKEYLKVHVFVIDDLFFPEGLGSYARLSENLQHNCDCDTFNRGILIQLWPFVT